MLTIPLGRVYRNSMFQFVMALLITASLLVCPLRCQLHAEAAAGNQTATAIANVCSCCQPQSQQAPASQSEQCPDSDCDCADCICQGAVLEHHDSLETPTPAMLLVFLSSVPPCQPMVSAVELREWDQQMPHGGKFLNGRAARLAQHSLLI